MDTWVVWLQLSLALLLFALCARLLYHLHQARRAARQRHRRQGETDDGR
jgi:hypothetical protein